MKTYLLSIYQPDGPPPGPEILEPIMRELDAFNRELRDVGAFVFAAGLQPAGERNCGARRQMARRC